MVMDIFDLLEQGIVVGADREARLVVLWNESITFRVFAEDDGAYAETTVFTAMETPTLEEARAKAKRFLDRCAEDRLAE